MTSKKRYALTFVLPKKLRFRVKKAAKGTGKSLADAMTSVLMNGVLSEAPMKRLHEKCSNRRGRRSKTMNFTFTVKEKHTRQTVLDILALAASRFVTEREMDRPVAVDDLVVAILESFVAGEIGVDEGDPSSRSRTASRQQRGRGGYASSRQSTPQSSSRARKEKRRSGRSGKPRIKPHPEFPDVQMQPSAWQPGGPGRPPKGTKRSRNNMWVMPKGYRKIAGLWHPPMPEEARAVSRQKHAAKQGKTKAEARKEPTISIATREQTTGRRIAQQLDLWRGESERGVQHDTPRIAEPSEEESCG